MSFQLLFPWINFVPWIICLLFEIKQNIPKIFLIPWIVNFFIPLVKKKNFLFRWKSIFMWFGMKCYFFEFCSKQKLSCSWHEAHASHPLNIIYFHFIWQRYHIFFSWLFIMFISAVEYIIAYTSLNIYMASL